MHFYFTSNLEVKFEKLHLFWCRYHRLFFRRRQKNSRTKNSKLEEKTQNSSKKLKDSANVGVIYSKNQRKWPKSREETTKIPKSRTKHSKHYRMGTILKQKYWVFEIFKHSLKIQRGKTKKLKVSANPLGLVAKNRSNKKAWGTMTWT